MAAKIIAITNFKGGVGKTAVSLNVASILALKYHKKTLIVDLDPQASASLWLLPVSVFRQHSQNGQRTTYQIFKDRLNGTFLFDPDNAIIKGVPHANYPLIPHLDLLPGAIDLLRIEDEIHRIQFDQFYSHLYNALRSYLDSYDYILLDCPPNIYTVAKNAIYAADYCLIPYIPDHLSLSGFQVFSEVVNDFLDRVRLGNRERPTIGALVVSHFRQSGNAYREAINELEILLHRLKVRELVHSKTAILKPYIRSCVAIPQSVNEGRPVILHNKTSIASRDYLAMTESFVDHFENTL